jgi:glycerol-3-phosphate dehydrogenase
VVDRATAGLDGVRKSRTRAIKLGSSNVGALRLAVERRARLMGIDDASIDHLIRCYGDRSLAVLDLAGEEDLAEPLSPGFAPIAAEVPYCIRHEMATKLSDALARRTRLALIDPGAGTAPGSRALDLITDEFGWAPEHAELELEAHRQDIERERGISLHESSRVAVGAPTRIG